MKGGHTHNHVYNAIQRAVFRDARGRRACKYRKDFQNTFFMNVALQGNFKDFLKKIFYGGKKA